MSPQIYVGGDVRALQWPVPVMVSFGRLRRYVKMPRAATPFWVEDSRGFSELSQRGRWTITPVEYVEGLERHAVEIGNLRWASPQDWMCESWILEKTGKTEAEHQDLSVASVVQLRAMTQKVHIVPVLQANPEGPHGGLDGYLRCADLYESAGIHLAAEPVVGLGSVCRRQGGREIRDLVRELAKLNLPLHGFGVKTAGIANYGHLLTSFDSFAWSMGARYRGGLCTHGLVKHETNCPQWAADWRQNVMSKLALAA